MSGLPQVSPFNPAPLGLVPKELLDMICEETGAKSCIVVVADFKAPCEHQGGNPDGTCGYPHRAHVSAKNMKDELIPGFLIQLASHPYNHP